MSQNSSPIHRCLLRCNRYEGRETHVNLDVAEERLEQRETLVGGKVEEGDDRY